MIRRKALACVLQFLVLLRQICSFPLSSLSAAQGASSRQRVSPLILQHSEGGHRHPDVGELDRRTLLSWGLAGAGLFGAGDVASAKTQSKNSTSAKSLRKEPVSIDTSDLSSEICLLRTLPVQNKVFRTLQAYVEGLSSLQNNENDPRAWKDASSKIQKALSLLDSKRGQLQPVFNPDDGASLQIAKGERGEQLIESFRDELVLLGDFTKLRWTKETLKKQKEALLALSDIGELLVASFPFNVPEDGKFSYLPRLMGRARVTFTFRRKNELLGNVTIIADGFLAPITAGNFVDLSQRQFYTGLAVKNVKKKFGGGTQTNKIIDDFLGFDAIEERLGIDDDKSADTVTIPILGSFQEDGFYDPLTAKPRRIPLEVVRLDRGAGTCKLSYAQGFSDLSTEATMTPSKNVQSLFGFDIPGLVAFNHPDRNRNGGSTEFFSLQMDKVAPDKLNLFNERYAPFGYIIDGYDLSQKLKAGDVIDSTTVGDWGQLNLVKIRGASFSDVMQGDES